MSNPPTLFRVLLGLITLSLLAGGVALTAISDTGSRGAEVSGIEADRNLTRISVVDGEDPMAPAEPEPTSPLQPMLLEVVAVIEDPVSVTETTEPEPSTTKPAPPPSSAAPQPTTTQPPATTSPGPQTASGPLNISNESGVVYENLAISNPGGACVQVVSSSNVTIRNSTIGPCGDWGVFIDKSSGITLENTTIRTNSGKGGVYGHSSSGIAVVGNSISHSGRNPIQFDKVTGGGNRIEANSIASSAAEDMISVYMSGGTSGSWLRVVGNTLRENTGQSSTGSGIMVGDAGGSHILVQGNRLTNPGQAGIGVAGGSNIRVLNNTVASSQFSWSNVGIYVWDQYGSNCHNIEVRGNSVDWINSSGQPNPAYDGGNCGSIAGWGENSW